MRTIRKGSRGKEVKTLQSKLRISVDGIFGPATEAAVIAYQKRYGLSPDGIVGPHTWTALGIPTTNEPSNSRLIDEIIIHCSATRENQKCTSNQINESHRARGFSPYRDPRTGAFRYIGYHYYIHRDGTIEACRPENVVGVHTKSHNMRSIGICYEGGLDAKDTNGRMIKDTRTPEQEASLIKIIKDVKSRHKGIKTVMGHRDTSPDLNHNGIIEPFEFIKGCPCFDAIPEYKNL